jgi:2,3-dihydroxybenzoate-AMP ligase
MTPLVQRWPEKFAERYREHGFWTGQTFPQLLDEQVRRHGNRIAVVGDGERWSYAELSARAERSAAGLLALGLVPGDRVVVQLPNRPVFLQVCFALFRAGLIPVFALPAHRLTEVAHVARKAQARALIVADRHDGFDYRPMADAVRREVPSVAHLLIAGEPGDHLALDALTGDADALPPIDGFRASDVALVQLSGGSTGLSKLIPRTHDDYLYSIRGSNAICGVTADSVYLAALPVAHNFPMSSPGVFGALMAGGRVVMAPAPSPDVTFALIAAERVTITGLVPPLALMWMQAAPRTAHDLSSLDVLLVGGAKLMPEAARRIAPVLGCRLQQVFGMAEGLVNYTRLDDPDEVVTETQGRPISPDDEVLVVDDAGEPVADGMAGHLLTRGPYTIRGYHDDPAANARAFTPDGFYRTGDMVVRLPSGHLIVQGRATDHINRAGEKFSAEEVEDHLLAHPRLYDAAVVSMPDRLLGERSCAVLIADGEPPSAADVRAWMRGRDIAAFKIPDQIVFVDSFETTAVGKVSRKALRAALREQLLGTAA